MKIKKTVITSIMIILLVLTSIGCSNESKEPKAGDNNEEYGAKDMTLEEKISQMLILSPRFEGTGEDQKGVTEINSYMESFLKKYHLGGIIIFSENVENGNQIGKLISLIAIAHSHIADSPAAKGSRHG